jgi:putative membrane protein
VLSSLLRGPVIVGILWLVLVIIGAAVIGEFAALGLVVPLALGTGGALVTYVMSNFDFTVAESPDGLRLRHGLLETRAQTVAPGRVQAVRIVQPLLWRRRGWVRVDVNVAGYGGGEGSGQSTTLLPVAPRPVALRVLAHVLPGVDINARARWRAPLQWRQLGVGTDDRIFVARRGRFFRELMAVPHARTQSVRLTRGPWQRHLGLATVHVDTAPGPVRVDAAHRGAMEARQLVEAQARRAQQARAIAVPQRWMTTAQSPPVLEQGQGGRP